MVKTQDMTHNSVPLNGGGSPLAAHARYGLAVLAVIPMVLLLGLACAQAAQSNACENCHKDPIFRLHNHKLYSYYQDWVTSPHSAAGLSCDQCHGGDPSTDDIKAAHKGIYSTSNPKSRIFYKNQPQTCGTCHAEVTRSFTESKHFQTLTVYDELAPNCSTCHRAMNRKPYYHDIVDATCRSCHKRDMLNSVSERAEEILRRLNIAKGYLGWTGLYYDMKGWPGQTKQTVTNLNSKYHAIVAKGHSFDLADSDRTSAELLSELMLIFDTAWKECQQKQECKKLSPQ